MNNLKIFASLLAFCALISIPIFMGVGKYQMCKFYFPQMNRMACFFTQLPAVNTGNHQ